MTLMKNNARIQWDSIDFATTTNAEAAKILETTSTTVGAYRRQHGLPKCHGRSGPKRKWAGQDWSKTDREIAAERGIAISSAASARSRYGKEKAAKPKKKAFLIPSENYYRAAFHDQRPAWVPLRVRLPKDVMSDLPIQASTPGFFALAGDHDCESNEWGAISVAAQNGRQLGIKPGEFEVLEWHPNPKR